MRILPIALGVVAGLSLSAPLVFAEGGFNDNFDSYSTNDNLGDHAPWSGGGGAFQIKTNTPQSGTKVMRNASNNGNTGITFTPANAGDETFYVRDNGGGSLFMDFNDGATQLFRIAVDGGAILALSQNNTYASLGSYDGSAWVKIKAQWAANKVRFYVDDALILSYDNFIDGSTGAPDGMTLHSNANAGILLDTFSTTAPPPPPLPAPTYGMGMVTLSGTGLTAGTSQATALGASVGGSITKNISYPILLAGGGLVVTTIGGLFYAFARFGF